MNRFIFINNRISQKGSCNREFFVIGVIFEVYSMGSFVQLISPRDNRLSVGIENKSYRNECKTKR